MRLALHSYLEREGLVEFEDVRQRLQAEPWCLKVREKGSLYLLSYNIVESKFSEPIVQECRGLILRKGSNRLVAKAMTKFFNATEGKSALTQLDRTSVRYTEKLDGSLVKLYWDDERQLWVFGTNNMIDAEDAKLPESTAAAVDAGIRSSASDCAEWRTFADIIQDVFGERKINYDMLDKKCTLFFELIHPRNRVVVNYHKQKRLVFLGACNVETLEEHDDRAREELGLPEWIEIPKEFSFPTVEAAMAAALALPCSSEGFVAVDNHFHRVKMKSESYVRFHHFGDRQFNAVEILQTIASGEIDEVCAYLPKARPKFAQWHHALQTLVSRWLCVWKEHMTTCRMGHEYESLLQLPDRRAFLEVAKRDAQTCGPMMLLYGEIEKRDPSCTSPVTERVVREFLFSRFPGKSMLRHVTAFLPTIVTSSSSSASSSSAVASLSL